LRSRGGSSRSIEDHTVPLPRVLRNLAEGPRIERDALTGSSRSAGSSAVPEPTMTDACVSGSCFCGAIRFNIRPPTLFCGHCHCSMCRRCHGAGYVTWFAVPRGQFRLEQGEACLVRFRSSDHGTRSFCARCGSSLFCESSRHPDQVDVVLANMEGPIDRLPQLHVYFDDRADWVHADDGLPRLGGASGLEPVAPDAGTRGAA
jgi:hypothetical protein